SALSPLLGGLSGGETWQSMVGCDLLEDGSTRGYFQNAYDGRDFLAFDMETMTFTAADEVALVTKRSWEEDGTVAERWKRYLQRTCVEWLKKYLSYGWEVLGRKERPMVRVSGRKTRGTLTLSCRVYSFYPRPIGVSWLRGTEVRDQDTQRGIIAPNSDGTFYTWASIEVPPQEWDKYRCRVEHSSLAQPGLYAWEPEVQLLFVWMGLVAAVAVVVVVATAGIVIWKCRWGKAVGWEEGRDLGGSLGGSRVGADGSF
ncbi:HA1F protein, partial [Psilopogon haemacephalus]|nr:HA1F protein [Psilopogon haemacephalus]